MMARKEEERCRVGGGCAVGEPRMTLPHALRAEALRLHHSPLVPLHLACALAAGMACGAYFAYAPWDASMGADAFVQFLGAMMPLMAGIDTRTTNLLRREECIAVYRAAAKGRRPISACEY